jgi:hypothetical protein
LIDLPAKLTAAAYKIMASAVRRYPLLINHARQVIEGTDGDHEHARLILTGIFAPQGVDGSAAIAAEGLMRLAESGIGTTGHPRTTELIMLAAQAQAQTGDRAEGILLIVQHLRTQDPVGVAVAGHAADVLLRVASITPPDTVTTTA